MLYDLSDEVDVQRFDTRVDFLKKKGGFVELLAVREERTIKQNRYLHLLLSFFALEYGETLRYVKEELFKKTVNPDLFRTEYVNKSTGEARTEWRSTASLDTREMSEAIESFRNWAADEAGIYLPDANEKKALLSIERETKKYGNQIFL
jgi:hypothetical protein